MFEVSSLFHVRSLSDLLVAHYQKLQSYLEDIFEESDSFPANPTPEAVRASKYFSGMSTHDDHPLLSSTAIDKITRYVSRVQSSKRRSSTADGAEWDADTVGRVLRLLERSMEHAQGVVVFPEDRQASVAGKVEKKPAIGKGRKKGGKKSNSPPDPQGSKDEEGTPDLGDTTLDEVALQICEGNLSNVYHGGQAAEGCLVLLDSEGLTKQVSLVSIIASYVNDWDSSYPRTCCLLASQWSKIR